MARFSGENVLVICGSRGIGVAIVRRFAKEGGGVAFTYVGSKDAADTLAADIGATAIPPVATP
jgi:cyclic-di-GMP-binding biofilm dispersal mediator protein